MKGADFSAQKKNMKKFGFLILSTLLLSLCILLVSCGGSKEPKPGPNEVTITFKVGGETKKVFVEKGTVPTYTGSTAKPSGKENVTYRFTGWDKEFTVATEDATYVAQYDTVPLVTYEIRWLFKDRDIKTTVKENDIPVPPSFNETVTTNSHIHTFSGWTTELVPLTQELAANPVNRIITAKYTSVLRPYTVKFMVDGKVYATTETTYDELPTLPSSNPTKSGYSSIYWTNSETPVTEEGHVCHALFAKTDAEQVWWALNDTSRLTFSNGSATDIWDNGSESMTAANSILYLTVEIRKNDESNPFFSDYVDRVVSQLKYLLDPANNATPMFDLKANWPYCNLTAAIALIKDTPAIWNELSADDKSGIDLLMECFAYILTFGTDDDNHYLTGPSLTGNFAKGWNPNYRFANVAPMIFIAEYFGGADEVDALLLSFDFDSVTERLYQKGFMRAYENWHTRPVSGCPSPKQAMMNGGQLCYAENDKGYMPGANAGYGVGVRTAYTYDGYRLDQPAEILRSLFEYNYSGGEVKSSYDFRGQTVSYIDGYLRSPYEGELGQMLEFISSDGGGFRSSAEYCMHDFLMVSAILEVVVQLDIYDPLASENEDIFLLVWVGNQDFVFKYEKGYMSYSNGKSEGIIKEEEKKGYFLMKSLWQLAYGDLGLAGDESINDGITGNLPDSGSPETPSSSLNVAGNVVNGANVIRLDSKSTASAIVSTMSLSGLYAAGNHFYPTSENPNGNSLFIEFSILFNPTLSKLDYAGLSIGRISTFEKGDSDGLTPYYLAMAAGFGDLWCQTLGGFESTSGTTVLEGAACNKGNGTYPNIGAYGWHRIGVEYHQSAEIVSNKVQYTLTVSLYVDGILVSKVKVPHSTIVDSSKAKPGIKNLLFTAKIVDNQLVYSDNAAAADTLIAPYFCEGSGTNGSDVAYFVTKDVSVTAGTEFVSAVTPVTSPAAATFEVASGVTFDAKQYFEIN